MNELHTCQRAIPPNGTTFDHDESLTCLMITSLGPYTCSIGWVRSSEHSVCRKCSKLSSDLSNENFRKLGDASCRQLFQQRDLCNQRYGNPSETRNFPPIYSASTCVPSAADARGASTCWIEFFAGAGRWCTRALMSHWMNGWRPGNS